MSEIEEILSLVPDDQLKKTTSIATEGMKNNKDWEVILAEMQMVNWRFAD